MWKKRTVSRKIKTAMPLGGCTLAKRRWDHTMYHLKYSNAWCCALLFVWVMWTGMCRIRCKFELPSGATNNVGWLKIHCRRTQSMWWHRWAGSKSRLVAKWRGHEWAENKICFGQLVDVRLIFNIAERCKRVPIKRHILWLRFDLIEWCGAGRMPSASREWLVIFFNYKY